MEKIVGSLIGHRSRCFDVKLHRDISANELYCITSSEDGTAILWLPLKSMSPVFVFRHGRSGETEVLRSSFVGPQGCELDLVATCSANGICILWRRQVQDQNQIQSFTNTTKVKMVYKEERCLSHGDAQIYACEGLKVPTSNASADMRSSTIANAGKHRNIEFLLTAADSTLYLWPLCQRVQESSSESMLPLKWCFSQDKQSILVPLDKLEENISNASCPTYREFVIDSHSLIDTSKTYVENNGASSKNTATRAPFGGAQRNPGGEEFIFDAKPRPLIQALSASYCSSSSAPSSSVHRQSERQSEPFVVAVATSEDRIHLLDLCVGIRLRSCGGLHRESENADIYPVDNIVVNGGWRVFEATANSSAGSRDHFTAVCWHGSGRLLLAAQGSGCIALIDALSGVTLTQVKAHSGSCFGACFLPVGKIITTPEGAVYDDDFNSRLPTTSKGLDHGMRTPLSVLSWSSDGSLRQWSINFSSTGTDSVTQSVTSALQLQASTYQAMSVTCTLDREFAVPEYAVYSCDIDPDWSLNGNPVAEVIKANVPAPPRTDAYSGGLVVCAGGGTGGSGFLGSPVHLLNYFN